MRARLAAARQNPAASDYAPPVPGHSIGSPQGWRTRRGSTRLWHNGVDIGAPKGTPILAIAAGTIDSAWTSGSPGVRGYGNVIVIRHGPNVLSMYAHCDWTRDDVGSYVQQGEQIAGVGNTSNPDDPADRAFNPHLHLEIVTHWPLRADDTASRYDVVATLESIGIDTATKLRWRAGPPAAAGAQAQRPRGVPPLPPSGDGLRPGTDWSLIIGTIGLIIIARRAGWLT